MPAGADATALVAELRRSHPDAHWRARGTRDVQPQVARFTDRLASYLTMAALTTLLIGGVGVALAIQNYLAGKTTTIATLKCLGARSRLIFRMYLLQFRRWPGSALPPAWWSDIWCPGCWPRWSAGCRRSGSR